MVTLLESGLFAQFNPLFVFLFVAVGAYAILSKIKILGEHKGINFFIAVLLGIVFSTSSKVSQIFLVATPWLTLMLFIFFIMVLMFMFLGYKPEANPFRPSVFLNTMIIFFILLIFILSAGEVNRQKKAEQEKAGITAETAVTSYPQKIAETLRHPAVLGLMLVLFIAVFAVLLLSAGK